jgi:hypothetical protein
VEDEAKDIGLTLPNQPSAPNLATGVFGDTSTGPASDFPDPEVNGRVLQREALDIVVQSARDAVDARKQVQEEVKEPVIGRLLSAREPRLLPLSKLERTAVAEIPQVWDLRSFEGMATTDVLNQFEEEGSAALASLIKRRRTVGLPDRKILVQITDYIRLNPPVSKKRTKGKSIKDRD